MKSAHFIVGTTFIAGLAVFSGCGSDSDSSAKEQEPISVDSYDDLPNCTKTREGEIAETAEGIKYTCTNGTWKSNGYASEEDLPNCTSKNEGKSAQVDKDTYVCSDQTWTLIEDTYETEDDLPKCSSKTKGKTAYISDTEAIVKCSGSLWENMSPAGENSDDESSSSKNTKDESSESKSSSSSKDESSSSSKVASSSSKAKEVEFEDGVLWKPSYGGRVRTFNSDADEYTFLDDETTNDWWHTFTDKDNLGSSTVSITFGSEYATIKTSLVYNDWMKGENGLNIASPEPYASAAFNFAAQGFDDISKEEGICMVYSAQEDFRLEFVSKASVANSYDYWDVWVPASSTKKTAKLKFSDLPATWWQTNSTTLSKALTQMAAMSIESPYLNAVHCFEANPNDCGKITKINNIKVYMIGEYDACPDNNTVELGQKAVEFEEGVMWEPSYGEKARSFFGDVNEYNFYSGDPSGWWYTYTDEESGGASVAQMSYQATYLQAKFTNENAGLGWAAAGLGFNLSSGPVDLTTSFGSGICLEYVSGYDFDFKVVGPNDTYWYLVPASASKNIININFTNYTDYTWQEHIGTLNNFLKNASAFQFEFASRHADYGVTNTIKIYKFGKYGSCGE